MSLKPCKHQSGVLGCARGPSFCRCPLYWAACALFRVSVVRAGSGALAVEHSAQGVSSGASHLSWADLILEEGSWRPVLLAGRGVMPLHWWLSTKCILNKQIIGVISGYNCSKHLRTIPQPPRNVGMMGGLCCAAACHLQASPSQGSRRLRPSVCPSESSPLSQARWLLGGTGSLP